MERRDYVERLRWNDKQGNSLRIDTAIVHGIEVETKTEGSDAAVWLLVSIEKELEFWRTAAEIVLPYSFIFPSSRGTAINTNNFLFRVLKEAGKRAQIKGVTHQMPRHVLHLCGATHDRERLTGTPAPQLLGDHARALHQVGAGECPSSGRIARPSAKEGARGFRTARELNPIESNFSEKRKLTA
jgi:integrase